MRGHSHGRHGVKVGFLVRTGSSLELGSLHLGADHFLGKECLSAKKEFMIIGTSIVSSSQATESVEIQLTLEGSELALAEVSESKKRETSKVKLAIG